MKTLLGKKACLGILSCCLITILSLPMVGHSDEGMYPISELGTLDLKAKGLELSAEEIFNPNKVCLVDGICRVNGCTGSFVSKNGLIITNHHCAYRAIQNASTKENDYLTDGFQAKKMGEEIPATGYTVRITESFKDVSSDVLKAVNETMSFSDRTAAIAKRRKEIEKLAEKENPKMRAEVAEMFAGKSYVLFLYTFIKDVRLVFAPPSAVGVFGGAEDNWEWPRHTGDFTFMRAYVAPDGSTAEYSAENVPFKPKRPLKVAAAGVNEGDFVMLLGYPGRTARHKTADYLRYQRDVYLPSVVELYRWQISVMESDGKADRAVALKHTGRIQGLANVEKRSRGQLKGLNRAKLVEKRVAIEEGLQAFIALDPERNKKYGSVLSDIRSVYKEMEAAAPMEFNKTQLFNACRTLSMAFRIVDSVFQRKKPDLERETAYMDRNIDRTVGRLKVDRKNLVKKTDAKIGAGMLERMRSTETGQFEMFADSSSQNDANWKNYCRQTAGDFVMNSKLSDEKFLNKCLKMTPEELAKTDEIAIQIALRCYPELMKIRAKQKEREGKLSKLYGKLITVKSQFLAKNFVPDANSTLRLTMGSVKGFSPEDAVYKSPITTLKGVMDKTSGKHPFVTPKKVMEKYQQRDFGPFVHKKLNEVPVAILYDTDTTGGNSGSPILNNKGELVGVNFDRAFEATINDFAWNKDYSRSIGVDIRYVLWITGRVYGAEHLMDEMEIEEF